VVSPQEMAIALKAGFSPEQITYTSSGVSFDEIEECVAENVLINIDNLSSLEKFGQKYGNSVPVLIRIRPNIEGGGNLKISTGHKESKFGIAIEQKNAILELVKKYDLNIVGIHQHTGSDIKDGKTYVVLTQNDGLVYKRLYNKIEKDGTIHLHSDNKAYYPYQIKPEEVFELWSFVCSLNPTDSPISDLVYNAIQNIQADVVELRQNRLG
jgi:diaminopimelate decarboxylase